MARSLEERRGVLMADEDQTPAMSDAERIAKLEAQVAALSAPPAVEPVPEAPKPPTMQDMIAEGVTPEQFRSRMKKHATPSALAGLEQMYRKAYNAKHGKA